MSERVERTRQLRIQPQKRILVTYKSLFLQLDFMQYQSVLIKLSLAAHLRLIFHSILIPVSECAGTIKDLERQVLKKKVLI